MDSADEEQLLEALRKKLGAPKKRDERKELEDLFGKKKVSPEDKLRKKLKRPSLEPGDEIHLSIQKLAMGGKGLGRHKGAAIFVPDAVPGDTFRVRIGKTKDSSVFAGEPLELISPSTNRVPPRCQYFGECGGCSLQHFAYTAQLKANRRWSRMSSTMWEVWISRSGHPLRHQKISSIDSGRNFTYGRLTVP